MYPPKVGDKQVRSVIHELTVKGRLPSGAAVRATLAKRYRSRGGVSRIYRLLAAEASVPAGGGPASAWSAVNAGLLSLEIKDLRDQVQEARERENQHRAYWHWQIGVLQATLKKLQPQLHSAVGDPEEAQRLLREVQAAELKADQLETLLRAFLPAGARTQTRP